MSKKKKVKKKKQAQKRPTKFNHFYDCVSTLKKSVYMIARGSEDKKKKRINWITLGTGFLVAPNRLITASHVINNLEQKRKHKDGDKYYLIRRDDIKSFHGYIFEPKMNEDLFIYPGKDLAIIYLKEDFYRNGNKIFLDKNEFIRISKDLDPIGKDIGILGYPLCHLKFRNNSLAEPLIGDILLRTDKGVINCKYKTSDTDYHYEFTLAFNPGNSGGPIFDIKNGKLISIVRGYKTILLNNKEVIIPEEMKTRFKEYKEKAFIQTMQANYSFGFSTVSFLDIFKEHNIL